MNPKKLMFIVTDKGKKYIILALVAFVIVISLNAALFALLVPGNTLEGKHIIIDPGHGGIDPGTNDGSTFLEKDINLQISQKLSTDLQSFKCFTSMTRDDDRSLDSLISANYGRHQKDLMARAEKFNSGAYDLFVSIHVNRSYNKNAIGPIVLYSSESFESRFLAECLQKRLNSHTKKITGEDLERKPVKSSFYILNHSDIPGVIIETGFLSNGAEKERLRDDSYQSKLSEAICLGLGDYFRNIEKARSGETGDEDMQKEDFPFNITNDIRLVGDWK